MPDPADRPADHRRVPGRRAGNTRHLRRNDLAALARRPAHRGRRLLEEYKPGRRLQTNVEFYTALLLHGLGFETPLFTPTFAISRVSGWIAHAFEQRRATRIIRPQSIYSGPRDRTWRPLSERVDRDRVPSHSR